MADQGLAQQGTLTQIAFTVPDIEKASKAWAAVLGVPVPAWHLTDPLEQAHTRYQGRPTPARAKLAFFHLGQVSIELIEPVDGPSTWRDGLDTVGYGVHHVAFHVEDADAAVAHLAKQGATVVQKGDYAGGQYIYIDSIKQLGVTLELLADRP
jgi:catechol 2,3-dioxygenase-like lactoylglutathione lyase family enzyme